MAAAEFVRSGPTPWLPHAGWVSAQERSSAVSRRAAARPSVIFPSLASSSPVWAASSVGGSAMAWHVLGSTRQTTSGQQPSWRPSKPLLQPRSEGRANRHGNCCNRRCLGQPRARGPASHDAFRHSRALPAFRLKRRHRAVGGASRKMLPEAHAVSPEAASAFCCRPPLLCPSLAVPPTSRDNFGKNPPVPLLPRLQSWARRISWI